MIREVNNREPGYPADEVQGGSGIYRSCEVNTLGNASERHSPPVEKDGRRDLGHGEEECQESKWVGEKRVPELEPDGKGKAGGEPATWARQIGETQEVARGQPKLGVRAIAAGCRLEPKSDREHGAGSNEQANSNRFVGPVVHA